MSGTAGGPLLEQERTDARRFCGYPAHGAGAANAGWRFFQEYGALEYRLGNLSASELSVLRSFLATLAGLEAAVPGAGAALDTDAAAVWTRNRDEVRDRAGLLAMWSRRLCGFLGVPPGPALASAPSVFLRV